MVDRESGPGVDEPSVEADRTAVPRQSTEGESASVTAKATELDLGAAAAAALMAAGMAPPSPPPEHGTVVSIAPADSGPITPRRPSASGFAPTAFHAEL